MLTSLEDVSASIFIHETKKLPFQTDERYASQDSSSVVWFYQTLHDVWCAWACSLATISSALLPNDVRRGLQMLFHLNSAQPKCTFTENVKMNSTQYRALFIFLGVCVCRFSWPATIQSGWIGLLPKPNISGWKTVIISKLCWKHLHKNIRRAFSGSGQRPI